MIGKVEITNWQVRRTRAVVRWYLSNYYGTHGDPGLPAMFFNSDAVGHFAISQRDFEEGDDDALFKLLMATVMFQRRQDVQIMRVLRGMDERMVEEITDSSTLLKLADSKGCAALSTLELLKSDCDLAKDPQTKEGVCSYNQSFACALKQHTVALKRYGHFGKVPTALALTLHEAGYSGLGDLYRDSVKTAEDSEHAGAKIEAVLKRAWRVSDKIAAMYLSMLTNPSLSPEGRAPWSEGVDSSAFVVIDSNVDLFLKVIKYPGPWTYSSRRTFIQALSHRIPLAEYDRRFDSYNPRIVQQAMYLFMSETNRRALTQDCSHISPAPCSRCDDAIRAVCPSRVME